MKALDKLLDSFEDIPEDIVEPVKYEFQKGDVVKLIDDGKQLFSQQRYLIDQGFIHTIEFKSKGKLLIYGLAGWVWRESCLKLIKKKL